MAPSSQPATGHGPAPALVKTPAFYAKAAAAGSLAAWSTHFVMVPIDVVKTRMQLAPAAGSPTTTWHALRSVIAAEGVRGLSLGVGPTNWGYLTQGAFKYGLYEAFKTRLAAAAGSRATEGNNRFLIYLGAAMAAEAIADLFLAPFEAVRIRMVAAGMQGGAAGGRKGTFAMLGEAARTPGGVGGLYKGLGPLLCKQVPYTAVKLTVFEHVEEVIYGCARYRHRARSEIDHVEQLAITAASGFVGGVASAVASHPADTILTKVNAGGASTLAILRSVRFAALWAGIVPRMAMVGMLASLQLLAYDTAKVVLFGLPTSQGIGHVSSSPPSALRGAQIKN